MRAGPARVRDASAWWRRAVTSRGVLPLATTALEREDQQLGDRNSERDGNRTKARRTRSAGPRLPLRDGRLSGTDATSKGGLSQPATDARLADPFGKSHGQNISQICFRGQEFIREGFIPVRDAIEPVETKGNIGTGVDFGRSVAEARKRKGLTQGQLGKKIGLTQARVSQIEQGLFDEDNTIFKLCKVLQIGLPRDAFATDLEYEWFALGRAAMRSPEGGEILRNQMKTLEILLRHMG